mgnify:CR=1 FL=1
MSAWLEGVGDRGVRSLSDAAKYLREGTLRMYEEKGSFAGSWKVSVSKELVAKRSGSEPGPWTDATEVTFRQGEIDYVTIGIIGLFKREGLSYYDLGFAFFQRYCHKGFGYESSCMLLDHIRCNTPITTLAAILSPTNIPSSKLLLKLGFRKDPAVICHDDEVYILHL